MNRYTLKTIYFYLSHLIYIIIDSFYFRFATAKKVHEDASCNYNVWYSYWNRLEIFIKIVFPIDVLKGALGSGWEIGFRCSDSLNITIHSKIFHLITPIHVSYHHKSSFIKIYKSTVLMLPYTPLSLLTKKNTEQCNKLY